MPKPSADIHIIGYSDKLSVRPGDTIGFKVSSHSEQPFDARLARLISADPNPAGPGIIERQCDQWFAPQQVASRVQPFFPGSYAISNQSIVLKCDHGLVVRANVFATLKKNPSRKSCWHWPISCLQSMRRGAPVFSMARTR